MATVIRTARLDLVPLDPAAVRAMIDGRRDEAQAIAGIAFPTEFPSLDELAGFLSVQLARMDAEPARRDWMARVMVTRAAQAQAVGHCGFHGPPETIGRAEIGYTVFGPFRGRGYAQEAAGALVRWAFGQGQAKVYASVSPTNAPSLAVVRRLGFEQTGEQIDDVDGVELVFTVTPESLTRAPKLNKVDS